MLQIFFSRNILSNDAAQRFLFISFRCKSLNIFPCFRYCHSRCDIISRCGCKFFHRQLKGSQWTAKFNIDFVL